ncbi:MULTISPECIES: bifunctional pantoate--beta-alanine ligase/(d)CMP kinase [Planktothricoides]|uniref:Bifunctional pantoate ligase/cytidylate kinase n=1 Tax=Planktothricoides raciborskii FACHB-1370 TaxID=2949576 RepID=A0ABR8ELE8_9CYAN|nr:MULTISPECIES: bifunctional pantoate--beta-alanine ligase/(d)CMP kinase [Planktothricoides]KOR34401.1 pantoate--beta-alanine ligase [Planktothricoides sp. SR001]MBD2546914.1 bifunctional pantoate--beta-alanine ligase/(d)CMP kinase [Planktothricoides raciborskii FACHB-1370]MBD2584579.1 bifunctional pantoate--beta-alanine ligase/(d)CMP kinase [Planktothricoides raciborskii FACHB-1261]
MRLFTTVAALRCYLDLHGFSLNVGFVPTMGALHQGHLSLVERAKTENDIVVVSIFVNPLQFGPQEDLQKYPRVLEKDRQLCEDAGVDVIFAPTPEEMGIGETPTLTQVVPPGILMSGLCGRSRLGHFQGVATIVTKLLNIVTPTRAYFGQKDAQQLAVIRRLVADLNSNVEIVGCPIVREPSGLALSSRNQYLSPEEKELAAVLYRSLQRGAEVLSTGNSRSDEIISAVKAEILETCAAKPEIPTEIDYVELVDLNTMQPLETVAETGLLAIAVRIGSTRLIDNIVLRNRQPVIAIDGPAGAGKSTVAKQVANQLGLHYLDTGAMYRAVTWLVLQSGIPLDDEPAVAELVANAEISMWHPEGQPSQISINGQNVTEAIRSQSVTSQVSAIAAQKEVRRLLVREQQRYGRTGGIVGEGRDLGTHVFPNAELKIYLTASVAERARRRQQDLINLGLGEMSLKQLEKDIAERDRLDSTRAIAPLRKATDAIEIQTDSLTIAQVVEQIVQLYQQRLMVDG